MIDITKKQISLRTAKATGKVICSSDTISKIKNKSLPKGDLLNIAKAAGLLASKNTSNLIPHCHPVSIDSMDINFDLNDIGEVIVSVEGKSIGRTGIEMEVLSAVSACTLTIYDLLKPIDKNMEITSIKLIGKTGGRTDKKLKIKSGTKAAILVCSDSTAKGTRKDKSGLIIKEMLSKYEIDVVDYQIVADEPNLIEQQIKNWIKDDIHFIFTTGGTGLGPRDKTVDTIKNIIERDANGISEAIRTYGGMRTPLAMLSRSISGSVANTLIITLPGSSNGAREGLEAILPGVFHARKMLIGEGH